MKIAPINISKVAASAGVSTATVSRVINQNAYVSPSTAERVWRAVRELGYRPNTHARALASGRSRLLGLIISDIANPFFPELVKSFETVAISKGYDVLVANTNYSSTRMAMCVHRMIERKVDGVAIMTSELDKHLVQELSESEMPAVFLDIGKAGRNTSNITVDYGNGVREAIQHLRALAHRRIGFISGPLKLKSAQARYAAFLRCLRDYGVSERQRIIVEGNHRIDGGEAAIQRLLADPVPPTAVLASNDLTAIGALRGISYAGLRVPEDISVIGFDDIELSQFTQPALTTVRLSRDDLGRAAFEALATTIEGEADRGLEIPVSTHLVIRETTARALRSS